MTTLDRSDMPALAGEYVLGLLTPEERSEIERQALNDPSLRDEIRTWRAKFSTIDDTADTLPPPADLWRRIEQSIGTRPETASAWPPASQRASVLSGLWSNLNLWRWLGLVGAAASFLLAIVIADISLRAPSAPIAVALLADEAKPGGAPGAIVEAYADGSIRLVPLLDIPVPPGRTLQVWTLWDRAVGPVPLGVMPRAENVRLARAGLPQPRRDQIYEITLEPDGGSPVGRPTGPILYKGLATLAR